jgi:hypothetical protein
MNKAVIGVALILAGAFAYWMWWQRHQPAPALPSPPVPVQPVAAIQPPDAQAPPAIKHPIEKAPVARLPALDDSDPAIRDRMNGLFGKKRVLELFWTEGFIRRVVATIDNLARDHVAPSMWPVKPVEGELQAVPDGAGLALSPRNAERYAFRLRVAEAVNPKAVVAVYVHFYSLFQRAYQELGSPDAYFNDRLIEVIDHLLATPEVNGPVKLTRPRLRYEFADPDLQMRSAGQKILLRMGPANAARIKALLRTYRQELTTRPLR